MSRPIVECVDYTEKSVAVFGLDLKGDGTKAYKGAFAAARGLFNPKLTRRDGFGAGWIFPKSRRAVAEQLVSDINSGKEVPGAVENSSSSSAPTTSKYTKPVAETIDNRAFLALVSRVEQLEQELYNVKKHCNLPTVQSSNSNNSSLNFDDPENDEDEEAVSAPAPRLLKKKGTKG